MGTITELGIASHGAVVPTTAPMPFRVNPNYVVSTLPGAACSPKSVIDLGPNPSRGDRLPGVRTPNTNVAIRVLADKSGRLGR
jgi:hypothetical protein